MKTRTGFVSNSSSSSFMLLLPRKPADVNDCHEMIYPNKDVRISYDFCDDIDMSVSTLSAAKLIYDQIIEHENNYGKKHKQYSYSHYTKEELVASLLITHLYVSYEHYDANLKYLLTGEEIVDLGKLFKECDNVEKEISKLHSFYSAEYSTLSKINKDLNWTDFLKTKEAFDKHKNLESKNDEYRLLLDNKAKEVAKNILARLDKNNTFLGIVEFSDNDGEISTIMEHGNAFDQVKHVRICQH